MKALFEKLEQPADLPFLLKEIKLPAFDIPFHFHPEMELTLILESQGRRYVGDHVGNFEPGDLILLGKNLPHFWHNTENGSIHSRAVVVHFEEHFLGSAFFKKGGMQHISNLFQKAGQGIRILGHSNEKIQKQLKGIFLLDAFGKIISLLSILNDIAISEEYELLASPGYKATFNEADSERINAICQYVSNHFAEEIEVSYVASSIANMSVSAFCHYFKKRMNKTFTKFVNEVRIGEANRQLIGTDSEVSSIGFRSGYRTLSNFYKQFGLINGMSPQQYRKQFRR